ncbi:hypothetical protein Leryth_001556 [Lithospermum erythrorhizon]|nr:hypothetical protein Leryth_001556 [Lithospermum erythrorhizon]
MIWCFRKLNTEKDDEEEEEVIIRKSLKQSDDQEILDTALTLGSISMALVETAGEPSGACWGTN